MFRIGVRGTPLENCISEAVSQIWRTLPAEAETVTEAIPLVLAGAWREVTEIEPARRVWTVSQCPLGTWTVTWRPKPPEVG